MISRSAALAADAGRSQAKQGREHCKNCEFNGGAAMRVYWMKRHDGRGKIHAFRDEGIKSICGQAFFGPGVEIYGTVLENEEMCLHCKHHLRGRGGSIIKTGNSTLEGNHD